ncbi:MAG: hypothetical protein WC224_00105 [Sphaerochaetaceae bacterium]
MTTTIVLLTVRILEHEFSSEQIIKALRVANVAQLNANTYLTLNDGGNKEKRLTYNN